MEEFKGEFSPEELKMLSAKAMFKGVLYSLGPEAVREAFVDADKAVARGRKGITFAGDTTEDSFGVTITDTAVNVNFVNSGVVHTLLRSEAEVILVEAEEQDTTAD